MQSVSITRHPELYPSESDSVFLQSSPHQAFYKRSPKYVKIIGGMLSTWPRYELKVTVRRRPLVYVISHNFYSKEERGGSTRQTRAPMAELGNQSCSPVGELVAAPAFSLPDNICYVMHRKMKES